MENVLRRVQANYPQFTFRENSYACWSPEKKEIIYINDGTRIAIWSFFHEMGHALAGHIGYDSDINLLQKEVEAWGRAEQLAHEYDVDISLDHIQDCLDTYRDWLYRRSQCPSCLQHGVQHSERLYKCLNCRDTWKVTASRFCRPYRLKGV